MKPTASFVGVVLAAALTLATMACGGAQTPAATADRPKTPAAATEASPPQATRGVCSYITEAEASEILGQASKYRSEDDSSNCIVDPVSENPPEGLSVDFSLENGDGSYSYLLGEKAEPIDGLGDRAAWLPTTGMLAVVKGSRTVSLTISSFGKRSDLKEKAVAFALKVVGRF
jgi:hypothetical protein